MIFQQFSLLERETVYKNVALPMQCWKYPKDQIDKKVRELLELVGLGDKMNAKPRNLSGGQKQRVAVARALTMDPKILLCDEATSALDPKTTNSILDLLMEINQKLGITVIIVTHQMEVVRKACNKACILENGKIADEGTVKEIFIKQPQSLRRLLGEEEEKLPDTGHNIQISYLVKEMKDGEFNYVITDVDSNDARFNDENSRSNTQSKQNGTPNEKGISEFIFDEMTYTAADMSGATENEDRQHVKSLKYTV